VTFGDETGRRASVLREFRELQTLVIGKLLRGGGVPRAVGKPRRADPAALPSSIGFIHAFRIAGSGVGTVRGFLAAPAFALRDLAAALFLVGLRRSAEPSLARPPVIPEAADAANERACAVSQIA